MGGLGFFVLGLLGFFLWFRVRGFPAIQGIVLLV